MVRVSLNQEPWFLFLLDTGSEPSMATRSGLRRLKPADYESAYPMTLEGIGSTRVSWGKISNVTIGADRFMVRFKDLVIKEDATNIEDGVLGSSFLSNFDTEIRFSTMTLALVTPLDRLIRERDAASEVPATGH
jgi:hypothetical protein